MGQKRIKGIVIGILLLVALAVGAGNLRFQSVDSYRAQQEQAQQDIEASSTDEPISSPAGSSAEPAASGGGSDFEKDQKETADAEAKKSAKSRKSEAQAKKKTEAAKNGTHADAQATTHAKKNTEQAKNAASHASGDAAQGSSDAGKSNEKNNAGKHPKPTKDAATGGSSEASSSGGTEAQAQESQSGTSAANNDANATTQKEQTTVQPTAETVSCTIEIRCDRLVENKDKVARNLWKYIPDNGTILRTTTVAAEKGASVYDVLEKACKAQGIAIDAEYTPLYKSYYIKGIAQLYEKQAGDMSGWIYQVNGTSPNRGASAYKVSAGDVISWRYTCDGKTS